MKEQIEPVLFKKYVTRSNQIVTLISFDYATNKFTLQFENGCPYEVNSFGFYKVNGEHIWDLKEPYNEPLPNIVIEGKGCPKVNVLDHGYIKFIEAWGSDERIVESARMSTDKGFLGWGDEENPGDEKLLAHLWNKKHSTPFEFGGLTLEIKAPIMVFREWHRHRTQSYNEMSARYVPLPDENYLPTLERLMSGANTKTTNKQAQNNGLTLTEDKAQLWLNMLENAYDHIQDVYDFGISIGVPKELARLPVPVARYSRMRVTANLRNWLAFLALRESPDAQYEIRVYANEVCRVIAEFFPRTHSLYAETYKELKIDEPKPIVKLTQLQRLKQYFVSKKQG